jgi:hypothetical protein
MSVYKNNSIEEQYEEKEFNPMPELEKQAEHEEMIYRAEQCGLTHTGEYENGLPQFIGDNRAWDKFNNGNF